MSTSSGLLLLTTRVFWTRSIENPEARELRGGVLCVARVGEQNLDLKPTHLPRYIIALEHMDLLLKAATYHRCAICLWRDRDNTAPAYSLINLALAAMFRQ